MRRYIYFVCSILLGYNKILSFLLFNIRPILQKRLIYSDLPKVYQRCYCRGKGTVLLGSNMSLGYSLGGRHKGGCIEIQARGENAVITIGRGVATNNNIMLCAMNNIRIGDNVLIGERVTIMDFEAHGVPPNKRHEIGIIGEVVIAENVWIGNNATILKNTYIGENTIVAAGAVVSGRFPANVIIGGIPAKVIKHLPNE